MSSYINNPARAGEPGHDWDLHTYQRLAWAYGYERADSIIDGRDPATLADLRAWRRLGSDREAA